MSSPAPSPSKSRKVNFFPWLISTDLSRVIAGWVNLAVFAWVSGLTPWTLLCVADVVQLSLRGERRLLRALTYAAETIVRVVAAVLPAGARSRADTLAGNLADYRTRLKRA